MTLTRLFLLVRLILACFTICQKSHLHIMVRLLCSLIRHDVSFNLIYRSRLYYYPFGSYGTFYITAPRHPWGTPIWASLYPYTSTPLPPGQLKLNQRRVHFWGQKWPSPSRLGDPAPALLGVSFGSEIRLPGCSTFFPFVQLLFTECRWR